MSTLADPTITGDISSTPQCQPYVRDHDTIGEPGERAIAYLRVSCPGCGTHSVPVGDRCVGDVRSWQRSRFWRRQPTDFVCRRCDTWMLADGLAIFPM